MEIAINFKNLRLAVIGLGYVGLPLATEFAKSRAVVGFDINKDRINELKEGFDSTHELNAKDLLKAKNIKYSYDIKDLVNCNCYIITVPTPVNDFNQPDMSALFSASSLVGDVLKKGDIVIYESTVYPGATEYECCKILSERSGLTCGTSMITEGDNVFYVGYSPERINPGDKTHKITNIIKIVSGSTPEITDFLEKIYASIIPAGIYKANSIRVAEAAKVIENIQRDVNIALINELTIIFEKLGISTEEVLEAAGTKWNFLPFKPGLVGGHCIGVDPYYLTHKAEEIGFKPEMILAGRRINEYMANYVAERIIKAMLTKNINILGSRILVLGITYKENCSDIRNSKIIDLVNYLQDYKCNIDIYDNLIDKKILPKKLQDNFVETPQKDTYDVIVLAVKHQEFINQGAANLRKYGKTKNILIDIKYAFDQTETDDRL